MPAQAQKGGRGIGLPILDPGTTMGVDGQLHVSALLRGKNPCTNFTGGWLGTRSSLDESEKSYPPHQDSNLGPSSPYKVAILTTFLRTMRKSTWAWGGVVVKALRY
jgi:hypothetical protein